MGAWEGRGALIISGAPETDLSYVRHVYEGLERPVVICADGGMRFAQALGLRPDLVVADFDSSDRAIDCAELIRLTPEKDDTDTQHCVREAIARGCRELALVCALGGRVDHMMGNLALCEYAWEQGAHLTVYDRQNRIFFHGGSEQRFRAEETAKYVSIVPLDRELTGVTLTGLKYPLQNAVLTRSMMISISNEPAAAEFTIASQTGRALIIFAQDA